MKEVIHAMKKIANIDFEVGLLPRRAGDPSALVADNSKIKREMNWSPRFDNFSLVCKSAFEWEKLNKKMYLND